MPPAVKILVSKIYGDLILQVTWMLNLFENSEYMHVLQ